MKPSTEAEAVPAAASIWQSAVHDPGLYDLEVDTSALSPIECAELIRSRLQAGVDSPSAFERIITKDT